jgi:erythromycin esterase-like protein
MADISVIETIRREAVMLHGTEAYPAILNAIGDAEIVLLGEATHGTHEFYRARTEITKRLLAEKNFSAIAVECDWPDALQVSRHIQSERDTSESAASGALGGFSRFPRWMWRNADVLALVNWLREFNASIPEATRKAGFFGLDLYSLRNSMDAVIRYLSTVDPEAEKRARIRYACFDHLAEDPQQYGFAVNFGMRKDCEREVVRQLAALSADIEHRVYHDGIAASDEAFYAQQNARVAQNAESYYRTLFQGRDEAWNVRDTHMADTLDALRMHLEKRSGRPAKIVVWAHNSHIGDARATEMGDHGQLNLGQLVRQRHGEQATFLLGFTTRTGTVTAASDWDGPPELKTVREARHDSYEHLFHQSIPGNFFLPIAGCAELARHLHERRLERAIGVVYLPDSERISHYFHADIAAQLDAVMHFDSTRAVKPLDRSAAADVVKEPETYPSGM